MEVALDSLPISSGFGFAKPTPERRDVAGLTVWDGAAPLRQQIEASGRMHAAASAGTAAILFDKAMPPVEELLHSLKIAAQHDVRRVRFVLRGPGATNW
jgi:hypothetical protein